MADHLLTNIAFLRRYDLRGLINRILKEQHMADATIQNILDDEQSIEQQQTAAGAAITNIEAVLNAQKSGVTVTQDQLNAALAGLETIKGTAGSQTAELSADAAPAAPAPPAPPTDSSSTGTGTTDTGTTDATGAGTTDATSA